MDIRDKIWTSGCSISIIWFFCPCRRTGNYYSFLLAFPDRTKQSWCIRVEQFDPQEGYDNHYVEDKQAGWHTNEKTKKPCICLLAVTDYLLPSRRVHRKFARKNYLASTETQWNISQVHAWEGGQQLVMAVAGRRRPVGATHCGLKHKWVTMIAGNNAQGNLSYMSDRGHPLRNGCSHRNFIQRFLQGMSERRQFIFLTFISLP